ncbi:MAG TPA: WYL domain-containing protein [Ktedonobacterales bacterium]|jgi:predicted DNA-binding transcriptional regulator YafY|nr:WYL domain-containing protein [Ktedonobacterales bacterium]
MRASRLLALLLLLQTRGRMTGQELARELEVSVRTVYRDAESLSLAGIPIYADRGPTGGFQLVDGYRTRLTGMSGEEAEALFLAGAPSVAAELGLGATLASAQLKLLAALPSELRASADRIRDRFYLDAPGWFQDADEAPYLAAVAAAVWNQRVLQTRYQRAGRAGERMRTLEPLGLVLKAGAWYLVARARPSTADTRSALVASSPAGGDGDAHAIRIYRVSRILALETLEERFGRPGDFDLAAHWRAWSQEFEARIYHGVATVRFSARARELMAFSLGPTVARAAAQSASAPDQDGWTTSVIPIESIQHAVGDLLRLGADAEILEPPELRAWMVEMVSALAARYLPG